MQNACGRHASLACIAMSVGKILRKIVKKWLKKDSETGVVEPTEYELYAETKVPLATGQLDSEPCLQDCMFCIERDGTYGGGDLNRNVHISDEMGFSNDSIGYRKCHLDEWDCELSETSYSSSCPLHGLNNFMGDSTEFPLDATCHSSQSPVPLCVCETCYIFVSSHLSLRLPSTPSASPRTAAADAAGQPLCDADTRCWSNQCPTGQLDSSKVSSKTARLGMTTKEAKLTDCDEDSSISVVGLRTLLASYHSMHVYYCSKFPLLFRKTVHK